MLCLSECVETSKQLAITIKRTCTSNDECYQVNKGKDATQTNEGKQEVEYNKFSRTSEIDPVNTQTTQEHTKHDC